jgi:hypothetical protein
MVDVPDNSTGWIPFLHYARRLADQLIPEAAQDAEHLVLKTIHNGDLDFRWHDANGHEHIGIPAGFNGLYFRYDYSRDALRDSPFAYGHILYRPEVRERQRTTGDAKPVVHSVRDAPEQWPWQKDPLLCAKEGYEARYIQRACERLLDPSAQHESVANITKELRKKGFNCSDTSVRRAFFGD